VIALTAMKADPTYWRCRISEIALQHPAWSESEIGWQAVAELSATSAELLRPAFQASNGRNGRLSIQVDPRHYRDAEAMTRQAVEFSQLAPNIIVKIPAIETGLAAIEEATRLGVSVNATVSFTVSQAVAVAEAIERGLVRRETAGDPVDQMGPVCTIMGGRLEDWIKLRALEARKLLPPGYLEWSGTAVVKRAYEIYQERSWRTRLLSAAFRNELLLTEVVGGDLVVSPPFEWLQLVNGNYVELPARMDVPVDRAIIERLYDVPDFAKAFDPDGLQPEEFLDFGLTRRTLRQFLGATADIESFVRDVILPAP